MAKAKGKGKGAKIGVKKRNKMRNKLTQQGKMKVQRHKKKAIVVKSKPNPVDDGIPEDEEPAHDSGNEMLDMVDQEDLDFLEKAVANKSYSFFKKNDVKSETKGKKRKNRVEEDEGISIEDNYMHELKKEDDKLVGTRTRYLLPIKTDDGLIRRAVQENIVAEPEKGSRKKVKTEEEGENEKAAEEEEDFRIELDERDTTTKPVSVADMLVWREEALAKYKFKIGLLCSGLLEDPELKIMNIKKLLEIYDEWHPELQVTLKKLVLVSLTEVFKDILPSYQIKHQDDPEVKLKKDTRRLQDFEKRLLKGYREYLMKLEKLASKLYRKKGDTRNRSSVEISLGELSIKCYCDIIVAHPYFNYSKNIIQVLVPYLDNTRTTVRATIVAAFKTVFHNDKRGEITLHAVRRINDFIKKKRHAVKTEMILVLETLKLSDIKLDDIKEEEAKHKAAIAKKKRLINLSKKERKRQKKLTEVEQELLETAGQENKKTRHATLTEVTKTVFTIYFRILKNAPSTGLLSATLQGLAKFAMCINIEFYLDLVVVLDNLMKTGTLGLRERLHCILTVFTILSGQGESLNIDPNYFYRHLYSALLEVHGGGKKDDCSLLLQCLDKVLVGRRKKLTQQRLLGFLKRLTLMSLHQPHHVVLGFMYLIKQILQMQKSAEILLDLDATVGEGIYLPELDDPEHCNASTTSLYELIPLQSHYHPIVRQMAEHVAHGVPANGNASLPLELAKLSWSEALKNYDSSDIAFNPSIPKNPPQRKEKLLHPLQMEKTIREKYASEFCITLDGEPIKSEIKEEIEV